MAAYHVSLNFHLRLSASSKRSLPAIVFISYILVSEVTKRLGGNIEKLAGGKRNCLEEIQTWSIMGLLSVTLVSFTKFTCKVVTCLII